MKSHNLFLFSFFCFCLSFSVSATNFSFTSFSPNDGNITVLGSAGKEIIEPDNHPSIRLSGSGFRGQVFNTSGRAYYAQPIQLWNPDMNVTTDFNTVFEFTIQFTGQDNNMSSGGISFFVAAEDSLQVPSGSGGGWLGLFNETNDANPSNRIVAVEFDTFKDSWDPSDNHVGINVNSIVSEVNSTWTNTMVSGDIYRAQISYNGTSNELSVFLKDPQVPVDVGSLRLTRQVDLRAILPEKVFVGFSGSSGSRIAIQLIRNWNFTSTLEVDEGGSSNKTWLVVLVVGLAVLALAVSGSVFFVIFLRKRRRRREEEDDEESYIIDSMDEDFEMGTGPKRFSYKELVAATNGFSEEGKLGQGGFGGVYKGFLNESSTEIAVKKISSGSRQGKKEYVSEVKTISRLRHRNLVQLIGWSHERGDFLLVYEFMPNGSLDSHLFPKINSTSPSPKRPTLPWDSRYKIAQNLAAGLLYLHEEWEQCVVHRDIKSSNVMLDSNFTAKLGDFGLARLVDHDPLGSQMTTVVAGTMGYMAPEYLITGKASTESDVFSFGVVALELACGRKAVETAAEESKISLVSWVWGLNSRGRILEAVDESLGRDFDIDEMIRLMKVGLWCAHPDHSERPSIRKAVQVLSYESPPPSLPSHVPVPKFYPSLVDVSISTSYVSSEVQTDQSQISATQSNMASNNKDSSTQEFSSKTYGSFHQEQ